MCVAWRSIRCCALRAACLGCFHNDPHPKRICPIVHYPAVVDEAEARTCVVTHAQAFKLSADNRASTLDTLEGLQGSRQAARNAVKRCKKLFDYGSKSLERNWASMCVALGGDKAAARQAVLHYPPILATDVSQPKVQRRRLFLERNFGISGCSALNSYLTHNLLGAAPRLA